MRDKKVTKIFFYIVSAFFSIYVIYLHVYQKKFLWQLCRESGPVEWPTALLYFFSSLIFLYICKKNNFKNIWCWGYAALFFVIASEEINWGQRIFSLSTPELLMNINVQQEISIHNIQGLRDHYRFLALLVVIGICCVLPLLNRFIHPLHDFYKRIKMPVFPLWATGLPAIAFLFMFIPRVLFFEGEFVLDEIGELLLAVSFFIFSVSELRKYQTARP